MTVAQSVEQALRSSEPFRQLRSLVEELFAKGESRDSVLAAFESARQ